jgi:16S rRNA processing protein RimM
MSTGFLEVGKIVSAQGLKGELKVYPNSDFPERFLAPGKRWLLRPGAKEPDEVELVKGRYLDGKGLYVVQLAGVETRDQAEALQNAKLLVRESDRPVLQKDEFYVRDLIGLAVFEQATQRLIGHVVSIIPAGNDLLEVKCLEPESEISDSETKAIELGPDQPKSPNPKTVTVLIPFVKAIVPVVDLTRKRIEITPPSGLVHP